MSLKEYRTRRHVLYIPLCWAMEKLLVSMPVIVLPHTQLKVGSEALQPHPPTRPHSLSYVGFGPIWLHSSQRRLSSLELKDIL